MRRSYVGGYSHGQSLEAGRKDGNRHWRRRRDWPRYITGIVSFGSVTDTTLEQWAEPIDVNLKGVFLCSRYAVPPPFVAQDLTDLVDCAVQALIENPRTYRAPRVWFVAPRGSPGRSNRASRT